MRMAGYDYSQPGAYFVTICVYKMINLFGKIDDGSMQINTYGEIAQFEWFKTPSIRPSVQLFDDEFIIMPNHIHGIIWILDVGVTGSVAQSKITRGPEPGSLGAIIGQYKSITTKRINKIRNSSGKSIWQRNYYDHIVRNERELDAIRKYIQTNPLEWKSDLDTPVHLIDF